MDNIDCIEGAPDPEGFHPVRGWLYDEMPVGYDAPAKPIGVEFEHLHTPGFQRHQREVQAELESIGNQITEIGEAIHHLSSVLDKGLSLLAALTTDGRRDG
jgi:hypothetical protein